MNNILLSCVTGFPNESGGGGNKVVYQLLKGLNKEKYILEYLSYGTYLNKENDFTNYENRFYYLKKKITNNFYYNISTFRKLVSSSFYMPIHLKRKMNYFQNKIKQNKWDIIHCHDTISMYYINSQRARKILTIHSKGPYVQEIEDRFAPNSFYWKNKKIFNQMELESLYKADIITFPSHSAKEQFIFNSDFKEFKKKDIRVIYNGVDNDYIQNRKYNDKILQSFNILDNNYFKVLNVADHIKPKNIDKLIEAMDVLVNHSKKKIILINIGEGPQTSYLRRTVNQYNLEKSVFLLGKLPNETVLDFMRVCDVLVMPSERVVFDMVILEALASGLPIIASNEGGNREIIADRKNGCLLKENTPNEIITEISNLMRKEEEIKATYLPSWAMMKSFLKQYEMLYDIQ